MANPRTMALLGSGEFEPWTEEMDRVLLDHATSGDGTVAIVPTASALEGSTFDDWAAKGLDHYATLGVPARVIDLRGRDDAERPDLVAGIDGASMIFFSGGNPAYLARTLAGSSFWDAVVARVEAGAVFAGCSGGACIAGSFAPESMTEFVWEEGWKAGLELLPNVWILPHFDALDRHRRGLREYFLTRIPESGWSLGIDEGTAVVHLGDSWTVFGGGGAFLGKGLSARRFAAGETFSFETVGSHDLVSRDLVLATEPLPPGAGPIGLLSSDQFSAGATEVDRALLERCGPRVGVVLEADPSNAPTVEVEAIDHYRALGAEPVRLRADDTADDVDVLFLAGGDPKQLVPALQDSPLWASVVRRWRNGLGLVGSSAGAMALSERCLFADPGEDLPTHWGRGLGPLRSFAVAPHAASRPDEWLEEVIARATVDVIAMDEGSSLLLARGEVPRAMGSGRVRRLSREAEGLQTPAKLPTLRLYHRTTSPEDILRMGFIDSLENPSRDGAWEGSWFADVPPLGEHEGPNGDAFLILDVPRDVAERLEWKDPRKPYREFVLPREIANRFGPPRVLAADGSLRDPSPDQLERGEAVWGADAED